MGISTTACYVNEYKFFRNVIQTDLGEIIKDLRKSHAVETETAPETSIVENIKNDSDAFPAPFKKLQRLLRLNIFCSKRGTAILQWYPS